MPSSNRGMFGRGNGTITVIEEPVRRSYRRRARIVFYVVWLITAALTATVAASRWHPVIALLAGLAAGLILGVTTAAIVVCWPVIRAIWWWLPETVLATALIYGWIELASHTALLWRLGFVTLVVAVLAAIRPVRAWLNAMTWCLVARHRIRTCFSEFIITNRTGSLPLILWARPSRVGERVWVWLRPGLCLADIQGRLDKIATACWAFAVTAEPASAMNAAFIRMDIKRRDALTERVRSPLLALIGPATPARDTGTAPVPTALDLADVTTQDVIPASRPARPGRKPAPAAAPPAPGPAADGDLTDWL